MSSSKNQRQAERRAQHDAEYAADCERRNHAEREHREKFGELEARLGELGIDPDLLKQYLADET